MTRLVQIPRYGAPDVLRVIEGADPSPGPGEVVVDVAACGVNFADTMARVGCTRTLRSRPWSSATRSPGTIASRRRWRGCGARRGARDGGHAVRGLRLASRGAGGRRDPALRPALLRAGRRDPGQLRDGLGGTARLRRSLRPRGPVLIQAAGGGVGIAATQIAKRAGPRSGTASPAQARRDPRTTGSITRVDYRSSRLGEGLPPVRPDPRCHRRPPVPPVATRCCGAGGRLVASAPRRVHQGEKRNLREVLPAGPADAARLQPDRADAVDSKAVIGLNMLTLWKDRGTLATWIDAARRADRGWHRASPWCPMRCRSTARPMRTGSSASDGTSARSCSYREALDRQPARLQPLILARVALAGPLCAVGLVVVDLDD